MLRPLDDDWANSYSRPPLKFENAESIMSSSELSVLVFWSILFELARCLTS